jgi:8-oxo-dGDP phosphatase
VSDGPGTHEFRTVSTRDIHVGRIMALREDVVAMPGGSEVGREVVEHFGAVAVVALDERDRVVLIHQYRHPLGRRLWEVPAGLLDEPGESALVAAQRELLEEVGLTAGRWAVLCDLASSPGLFDETVRVFLARDLTGGDRELLADDEEADLVVRRMPLAEALGLVFAGEIINSEAVTGIMAAHLVVTGAVSTRPADAPWDSRPTRFAARRNGR